MLIAISKLKKKRVHFTFGIQAFFSDYFLLKIEKNDYTN